MSEKIETYLKRKLHQYFTIITGIYKEFGLEPLDQWHLNRIKNYEDKIEIVEGLLEEIKDEITKIKNYNGA